MSSWLFTSVIVLSVKPRMTAISCLSDSSGANDFLSVNVASVPEASNSSLMWPLGVKKISTFPAGAACAKLRRCRTKGDSSTAPAPSPRSRLRREYTWWRLLFMLAISYWAWMR
jgi:hypothetical protein